MNYALITGPTFIRNRLHKAGEVLAAYDGPFGQTVKPCNADGMLLTDVKASVKLGAFGVQHVGAGRWVVTNPAGEKCSETFLRDDNDPTKAKALAMAEADRLNAGGDAVVEIGSVDPVGGPPPADEAESELPDA